MRFPEPQPEPAISIYTIHIESLRNMDFTWLQKAMPSRWQKAQRFVREEDRLLCLGAGELLRSVAGIESEEELILSDTGKPLAPGKIDFNLSHSAHRCAIVINHGAIGLDIEKTTEPFPAEAQIAFTEDEKDFAQNHSAQDSYRLWTMKESVLKATGKGFLFEPTSFSVLPAISGKAISVCGSTWHVKSCEHDGYAFSICRNEPIAELNIQELKPFAP